MEGVVGSSPISPTKNMKANIELNYNVGTNICMVTAYDDKCSEHGDFASRINIAYCLKHKYDFRVYTDGFDKTRPPAWSKILFVKDALKDYEWVFWIDADAAITNPDIPIEPFLESKEELVITKDFLTTLNFGIFFLRRSDFANWFLNEIWKKTEYMHHGVWEQAAVWELWDKGLLNGHTKIEASKKFNSFYHTRDNYCGSMADWEKVQWPEQYQWALGDFIVHFPGRDVKKKIRGLLQIQGLCKQ